MTDWLVFIRDFADWNQISAWPAFFLGLYAMIRMWPFLSLPGLVGHLFEAGFWAFGAYHWRMLWWDLVRPVCRFLDVWDPMSTALGGTTVNVVWNLAAIYATRSFFLAMHQASPKHLDKPLPWWGLPWFRTDWTDRHVAVMNRCLRRLCRRGM